MTRGDAAGPRVLELAGGPFERGRVHGERFADEVRANVATYLDRFAHQGADEATVYDQAEQFWSVVRAANADYAREMEGVAEGSGVPLADVALLNARWEILYGALADEARATADGCTAFGVEPSVTADGRPYLGQNWDWLPDVETFVADRRPADGPNAVAMTEAGIVGGKVGVNEHGLGVAVNGLVSASDGDDPRQTPMHVRFHEVLAGRTLEAAVESLASTRRAVSANVVLGSADGSFVDLELSPTTVNRITPGDGVLTHANHFEDDRVDSEFEDLLPDTLCREPRMARLLREATPTVDEEDLVAALRDHDGHPASICRHVDESAPDAEQLRTGGSYVVDLAERRLHATDGPPCESDYRTIPVAT